MAPLPAGCGPGRAAGSRQASPPVGPTRVRGCRWRPRAPPRGGATPWRGPLEGLVERGRAGDPVGRVGLERGLDHRGERRRDPGRASSSGRRRSGEPGERGGHLGVARVGGAPGEHLVEDEPERVDVGRGRRRGGPAPARARGSGRCRRRCRCGCGRRRRRPWRCRSRRPSPRPRAGTSTLAGLMSRWTIPWRVGVLERQSRPDARWRWPRAGRGLARGRGAGAGSRRRTSSITMNAVPSSSPVS